MYVHTISCEGNDGVGMAFASRRRVSSHHVQMRDGVCIERNEYHVNTHGFWLHIEYVFLSFLLCVACTLCCLELRLG
jgi:hypothetical protein